MEDFRDYGATRGFVNESEATVVKVGDMKQIRQ